MGSYRRINYVVLNVKAIILVIIEKIYVKERILGGKMNKNLMKAIDVIIMIITIPVMIVFYIPFAIFKGLTSEFVFDEYFNIWRKFLNILLYPIVKYQQRKEHYEELKQKIKYYRKECGRLNDVINELEKVEKEDKNG